MMVEGIRARCSLCSVLESFMICVWCREKTLKVKAQRMLDPGRLEHVVFKAIKKCHGLDEEGTAEVVAKHIRNYFEGGS